jgi:Site-specific recombinase XerD
MRRDYSLFQRENGVWYFWMYGVDGKRRKLSTGETAKGKARVYAENYCSKYSGRSTDSFAKVFNGWFDPLTCPYYKESLRNGRELSGAYMRSAASALKTYILPYWGGYLVADIRPIMIDDWKYYLLEQEHLSNKSVQTYMAYFSVMLDWAWRRELIAENPCKRVKRPSSGTRVRGVLTKDEVKRLFDHPWKSDIAYYSNLLAMLTGLRVGEVIGLRHKDIDADKQLINVEHSYDSGSRTLGQTKTRKTRCVPVPRELAEVLLTLNPGGDDAYVFSRKGGEPIVERYCLDHLRRELVKIGISLDEQKERGICFHSWRHFLNSQLRVSGIPDTITKEITGHASDSMMEHYTHLSREDMDVVQKVQEELVENR